jgi:DNA-binding transcriptional LysR family regulator
MVELRHLSYFRAIAEFGSIAKAATALNMTQPTLSRQIAQLEKSLGFALLERGPRGTTLTAAGEGLRQQVATIFTQVDRIPEVLRTFRDAERLINLGIPAGVPPRWFEIFLDGVRTWDPTLKISLHEANSEEQRRLLNAGLIDIGLMNLEPPEMPSALVLVQRFGCVVPPGSDLAGHAAVRLEDFNGRRVMAHSGQENHRQETRLRLAAEAARLRIDWVFRTFVAHGEFIAETSGVDVVLISEPSAQRQFPRWRWIPISESDPVNALMRTWAAWLNPGIPGLSQILRTMVLASREVSPESAALPAILPPRL